MSVDLTSSYLGMTLNGPIAVSACPLTAHPETLRRLEEAGASAAVMPSVFEEQIERDGFTFERPAAMERYNTGAHRYLESITAAKRAVRIPVIASLNGAREGGWVHYARLVQDAGADAIELNVHLVPTDPTHSAAEVESRHLDLVSAVRDEISIPLSVKLGPAYTAPLHFCTRLVEAGASGLVLFNRMLPPDLDLEQGELVPAPSFSSPLDVRLRLQWIGILKEQVAADLAATGGVHSAAEALKLLLVGADLLMVASALYAHGPDHLRSLVEGVRDWMTERGHASIAQLRGTLSRRNCPDPSVYERSNYLNTILAFRREPS